MKFISFWKSIIWFGFILLITFLPDNGIKRVRLFSHADKLIHLFLFLVFSLLMIFDAKRFYKTSSIDKGIVLMVILTGVLTGLFTELVQNYLIAERSGSAGDLIADVFGIMAGFGIYKIIRVDFKS